VGDEDIDEGQYEIYFRAAAIITELLLFQWNGVWCT